MKLCRLASLLLLAATLFATSCTTDDLDNNYGGGATTFIIEAQLPELGGVTRADVDADNSAKGGVANIDWSKHHVRIIACAYDTKNSDTPAVESVMFWTSQEDVDDGQVKLPMSLTYGKIYNIYMWVDIVGVNHEDLHYNTQNLPTVTYTAGDGPAVNDETYDAFYGYAQANLTEYRIITWSDDKTLSLQRAVSKLRIIATDSDNSAQSATLALEGTLYNGLKIGNPISYSGYEIANPTEATGDIITYGNDTADAQTMITAYLLTPAEGEYTVTATLNDASSNVIKSVSASNIPLHRGKMTTLRGPMFSSGEAWDGQPVEPTDFDGEWMIINTAGELLWLATTSRPTIGTTTYSKFRLGANIDVTNSTGAIIQSLNVGNGATFDGNGKSIKGFGPTTSALFGSVSGISVTNLTIEGYNATANTHIGVLVNELTGNSTFSNITIKDSSVTTTNGAAGGMVGYIRRANETARAESYSVTFSNCHTNGVTANGSLDEGYFVGYFSGYDLNEHLTFDDTCTVSESTIDAPTLYEVANQSCWLSTISDTRYNGMLGGSKYLRGRVTFGKTQFAPKWDGETTVEPMLANATYDSGTTAGSNRYVVYSPFDLAGLRAKTASPAALYLRSDVDMNGQGSDGEYNVPNVLDQYGKPKTGNENFASVNLSPDDNLFNPFSYVTTLNGAKPENERVTGDNGNYSIYNLGIAQIGQERAAFILYASGTTIHEHVNFRNCQTVTVHQIVATDAKAYGAIVVSNVDAAYTMNNIHAYDCRVFALQKVGTLGARINGTSTITNCTVNNCYVENYQCMINERFESGAKEMYGVKIKNVYADFYPHGEVGGMFGFIQGTSTITNCHVNNTTVYAFGQDDKSATIQGDGFFGYIAAGVLSGAGYYLVPGRHVSTMIGNIRATGTIVLSGCTINNSVCTDTNGRRWDKHNSTYNYIGQAYIVKFLDNEGTVTVDSTKLTVADCNKNTKR